MRSSGLGTISFSTVVLAIALVSGGCAAPTSRTSERPAACQPSFADADGWLGGDAAYSVPIDMPRPSAPHGDRATLWLFGDSFVGGESSDVGRQYPFVHNVVARSNCSAAGEWEIDFAWKREDSGRPRAFFHPEPKATWVREVVEREGRPPYYWPFAGFVHGDRIFVALLRVVPSEPAGPFALPFRIVGTDLARLTPGATDPETWPVDILPFSSNPSLVPASAFVLEGDWVFAFAFANGVDGRTPRALARLPIAAFEEAAPSFTSQWETFGRDGTWRPGLDATVAATVIDGDATEMSVHLDPRSGEWWAIESGAAAAAGQTEGAGEGEPFLTLRRARRLEGPWSEPETLLPRPRIEDQGPGSPFCYAGKAHPQFATERSLLVTYVCNLFAPDPAESIDVLRELARRRDLYRPIPVWLPRPPSAPQQRAE